MAAFSETAGLISATKISEEPEKHPHKKTKAWAEQLLDRSRRMFSAWHRRDEMTDAGFYRSMVTHRDRFLEIVLKPPNSNFFTNRSLPDSQAASHVRLLPE